MWSLSLCSTYGLALRVLAMCITLANTMNLAVRLWWLSLWSYWSVWIDVFYTVVRSELLGPAETKMSKNSMNSSVLDVSAVNCMWGPMELLCCRNKWLYSAFWMTKVSSTYLSHTLGLDFELFHEQVGYNGTEGRTMSAPCTCSLY